MQMVLKGKLKNLDGKILFSQIFREKTGVYSNNAIFKEDSNFLFDNSGFEEINLGEIKVFLKTTLTSTRKYKCGNVTDGCKIMKLKFFIFLI